MGGSSSKPQSRLGSGAAKMTAIDIAAKAAEERGSDFEGQIFIVTGANSGIGFETARALVSQHATVFLACRNSTACDVALKKINDEFPPESEDKAPYARAMSLDLSDLDSIRKCVEDFLKLDLPLHGLINNAGVMRTKYHETKQGFESIWGVNHLGPFLLTTLLLDKLKASAPARIVNVGSAAHTMGTFEGRSYDPRNDKWDPGFWTSTKKYGSSKFSNNLFSNKLHRMLQGTGVTSYVLHPGGINTNLARDMGSFFSVVAAPLLAVVGKTVEQGAGTTVYCALVPSVVEDAGGWFDNCCLAEPHHTTHDETLQDVQWEMSEELVREDSGGGQGGDVASSE